MRQRLFVMILKEELAKKGIESIRNGDDIYIDSNGLKKLTVSIATISSSSMKIHCGINIISDGTPDDVDTIGLFELVTNSNNNSNSNSALHPFSGSIDYFINDIVNNYINELNDIELDISKTNLL